VYDGILLKVTWVCSRLQTCVCYLIGIRICNKRRIL